jgi:uncharacterized membrane protein
MKLRISKLKLLILMAMSVVGVAASAEVLIVYYTMGQTLPLCPNGNFLGLHFDCDAVLGSRYSSVFGVPLELLALGYFLVNLGLVYLIAFGSDKISHVSMRTLFGWRFIGIVLVPYLVFVEVILIKAICVYCTIMHVAIVADFIIISYLLFLKPPDTFGVSSVPGSMTSELPPLD